MAHTIIGTAGHIDHGKTLLVQMLTGMHTDQAPQEKARGITIELGFAFFGDEATIIDVPGHERFVKTMVAGVSTIDLALLVIAAAMVLFAFTALQETHAERLARWGTRLRRRESV